jgi:hypothetical protein
MIPVSIGESLTEYLRIWAKQNKNLASGVHDFHEFFKWDRELKINLSKANGYYYKQFIAPNQKLFCERFSEKLKEPVGEFLNNADFTKIELHITYIYVGIFISNTISVEPTRIYPKMKVTK